MSYLIKHQGMEGQTECQHQVEEQQHNADQCPHNLPEHHNIDANAVKPEKTGD